MKQAKVLNETEVKRTLAIIQAGRHAERNRMAFMLSHLAGLRVGEIAALKISDVVGIDGELKDQIYLKPSYTKGNVGRTVFVSKKLAKELKTYFSTVSKNARPDWPLIRTQKRTAFSPTTLCQLFSDIYKRSGIDGATSHSGRRGFISKLAHSGTSAKVIMTLAGHKNLSTTQRYIDVSDDMMRQAVELV